MTLLVDRPGAAVIVIDVQNGVVAQAWRRDAVVANISAVVARARGNAIPVLWVRHHSEWMAQGSAAWEIVPELTPAAGEPVVEKRFGDAFEETGLEAVLAGLRVGRLVVTGAQTDACIQSTLHGAVVRGYDVTLVSDAHTTEDQSEWGAPSPDLVVAHTNLFWSSHAAPGREIATVATKDVTFGIS